MKQAPKRRILYRSGEFGLNHDYTYDSTNSTDTTILFLATVPFHLHPNSHLDFRSSTISMQTSQELHPANSLSPLSPPSSTSPPTTTITTTTSTSATLDTHHQQHHQQSSDQLRHLTSQHPLAPVMKERQLSGGSDKSARGRTQMQAYALNGSGAATQQRVGSRSPSSIPSSPTSVHSSSSAIFERDIEQPLTSPLSSSLSPNQHQHGHTHSHGHTTNPHRIPRSKTSEPLDQSVPSVLDSAVELLASVSPQSEEDAFIAVEAPVPTNVLPFGVGSRISSAIGSPVGRGSRSPSPTGTNAGAGWVSGTSSKRASMLLNLPSPPLSAVGVSTIPMVSPPASAPVGTRQLRLSSSPKSPPKSLIQTSLIGTAVSGNLDNESMINENDSYRKLQSLKTPTTLSMTTPTYESTNSNTSPSSPSSPTTTTLEHPPVPFPFVPGTALHPHSQSSVTGYSPPSQVKSLPGSNATGQVDQYPPSPTSTQPPSSYHIPQSAQTQSHPPSPSHHSTKRLSFISYNDLLTSTPISTLPLSSLTTSANSDLPPPHLPAVAISFPNSASSVGGGGASTSGSAAGSMLDGVLGLGVGMNMSMGLGNLGTLGSLSSLNSGSGSSTVGHGRNKGPNMSSSPLLDDAGGEWEREGLGRGLEERLEALMVASAVSGEKA